MNKEHIKALARTYGTGYTNRHTPGEPALAFGNEAWAAFCEALVAAQPPAVEARGVIEQCRVALAEELAGWDLDPPLHHVKQAHDRCVEWLMQAAIAQPVQPAFGNTSESGKKWALENADYLASLRGAP